MLEIIVDDQVFESAYICAWMCVSGVCPIFHPSLLRTNPIFFGIVIYQKLKVFLFHDENSF